MYLDSLRKHSRLVLYKITIDWMKLWRRERDLNPRDVTVN